MKKILLIALLAIAPLTANAGIWTKLSTLGDEVKKPTAVYNVEAAGWNIRVIEWVPASNPDYRCSFAAGSAKGGTSCYPAKK